MHKVVVLVGVCLAVGCAYERRDVGDEIESDDVEGGSDLATGGGGSGTGTGTGAVGAGTSVTSAAILQCSEDRDCDGRARCEEATECFRTCSGSVCDSGCTGACRERRCEHSDPPDPAECDGAWVVPWDASGCPSGTPVCVASGADCAAVTCAVGEARVIGPDGCSTCVAACDDDGDCGADALCVRNNGCAEVVCPKTGADRRIEKHECETGHECYGVCMPR